MRQVDDAMVVFLRARFREDETAARALKPGKNVDVARLRDRVLADVEAKHKLLDWVLTIPWDVYDGPSSIMQNAVMRAIENFPLKLRSPVALTLLSAYTDHPDFPPEWKYLVDESDEHDTSSQARTVR
ncbi:DUF6221 family protein [Streptomyces europaeiscabiei]|uniref:DUF6221 family protein n=1 Tax=Streptomyces europaeiscabiei TaxID=146819 RepID=UPI0029A49FFF|nr:DUF6221 family protein [Streptomyces europaeiscabiei]MDX3712762.1 DUF6221 family protein [Streptomyces europaeiscabiei]